MNKMRRYMEFRYVTLEVLAPSGKPFGTRRSVWQVDPAKELGLHVSAWMVQAEYVPEDSFFSSDHDMLNKVWELSR